MIIFLKLALAGRDTLAQSGVAFIPMYAMQSTYLLGPVCDEVDKLCRTFIWGGSENSRKVSLIPWEQIIKPKALGGLGFRDSSLMNKSFMLKIAWGYDAE